MSDRNPFKARLRAGQTQIGVFTNMGSPFVNEVLAWNGMDFLLVDMEHGQIDISTLAPMLAATELGGAQALVRVPVNDRIWIKRTMDMGARSIMVPQVDTADDAREAASFLRYPPHGVRGVAKLNRGGRFGTVPDYLTTAHDEACLIVQMESEESFNNLADIIAVDGVDGVFIGPADLAASMGLTGQVGHAQVDSMIDQAVSMCKAANMPVATVVPSADQAAAAFEKGYTFMAIGSDSDYLCRQVQGHVKALGAWRARSD